MRFPTVALVASVIIAVPGLSSAAPVAFSLGDGGTSLVFLGDVNANPPGVSRAIKDGGTGAAVSLTDLDFDKETGDLYGVSALDSAVYQIDPLTAVATFRAALPAASSADRLLNDWNNAIDRMRIIDGVELNFVFNQTNNTVTQFTDLAYAMGDANEGVTPLIVGNAYRDSAPGNGPEGGVQLGIDAATNALIGLANNAGVLSTIGIIDGLVVSGPEGGFDIFSTPDGSGGFDDIGYALLRGTPGPGGGGNSVRLVEIALMADGNGLVSTNVLRTFGNDQFGGLQGLAIIDSAVLAPIPLPLSLALLPVGLAALVMVGRRRKDV